MDASACYMAGKRFYWATLAVLLLAVNCIAHDSSGGGSQQRHLTESPLKESSQYKVEFDSEAAFVVLNADPTANSLDGANNLAQIEMKAKGGGYEQVQVKVTSLDYDVEDGDAWNIRPTRYWEELNIVKDVDASQLSSGILYFVVTEPCQVSVELGDPNILFETKSSYSKFSNLILGFNPPESSWPHKKPTLTSSGSTPSCSSAESGRSCIVGQADSSCDDVTIGVNTDWYFSSQIATSYIWGDGCGVDTKEFWLSNGARIFLDQDVIVYARAQSSGKATGVYGYGIMSNSFMGGYKDKNLDSVVRLVGDDSEVFGVTLMDATYRNLKVGTRGMVQWTKNFAWESETDCVSTTGDGMRVYNSFFKTNDDCLKPYFPNTTFWNNVVWHQGTGRAIMISWGNSGMNDWNYDETHQVLNTHIIHDQKAWSTPSPDPPTPMPVAYQAATVGYAALICIQHPNNNQIGLSHSPVLLENVYVEERIGILILITQGFAQLNGLWTWQPTDEGCTGNVYVKVKNLDLHRVTGVAGDSAVGGCDTDYNARSIENGHCLCTAAENCGGDTTCAVNLRIEGYSDPVATGVPAFQDKLLVGMNTEVVFSDKEDNDDSGLPWWAWFLIAVGICVGILCLLLACAALYSCCCGKGARQPNFCEEDPSVPDSQDDVYQPNGGNFGGAPPFHVVATPSEKQSSDDYTGIPPYRVAALTPEEEQQRYRLVNPPAPGAPWAQAPNQNYTYVTPQVPPPNRAEQAYMQAAMAGQLGPPGRYY